MLKQIKKSTVILGCPKKDKKNLLKGGIVSPEKFTNYDKVLHELEVHQIELRMQNDELQKANEALEESKLKYLDLYDFAPVGYVALDGEKNVVDSNFTFLKEIMTDKQALLKKSFNSCIYKEDRDKFYLWSYDLHLPFKKLELRMLRKDGSHFYAQIEGTLLETSNDLQIFLAIINITERKEAEDKIRESQKQLQEQTTQLIYANTDLQAFNQSVSHDLRGPIHALLI